LKPLRKNVAIAIDGGGIKGIICTRALSILENHLGTSSHELFRLAAGTSTGSIISAGIAAGISARDMYTFYMELGQKVFPRTLRSILWPLTHYRYSPDPLRLELEKRFGTMVMADFWKARPPTDVVITSFDLMTNHTRFIKPWKPEYADWPVVQAVQASCSVPTYFPVVKGRYVDGGVGAYANPCYLAAYEAFFILHWDPAETSLISLGTGRDPYHWEKENARQYWAWQWIGPVLGAFLQSADDQQVRLVKTFFSVLDFRRFQVDLAESIAMDDPSKADQLSAYGDQMGMRILNDMTDQAMDYIPAMPSYKKVP
jgi:predicted acylesterase/phospholipase RssA